MSAWQCSLTLKTKKNLRSYTQPLMQTVNANKSSIYYIQATVSLLLSCNYMIPKFTPLLEDNTILTKCMRISKGEEKEYAKDKLHRWNEKNVVLVNYGKQGGKEAVCAHLVRQ